LKDFFRAYELPIVLCEQDTIFCPFHIQDYRPLLTKNYSCKVTDDSRGKQRKTEESIEITRENLAVTTKNSG
jgi:hypothetical protein